MAQLCSRLDDEQAHQEALAYLAAVLGPECAAGVCWDLDHHLQGHLEVCGKHLVIIAPRDVHHHPHVMSEADWDALRHGDLSGV
jgi:hypothetical protein